MGVLKAFLFAAAGAFALGGVVVGGLLMKVTWLIGLPVIAIGLALGYFTFRAAKNFGAQATIEQGAQFERTLKSLAEKNGGSVSLQALLQATGETKESAQAKARELMGRGVCEMDFGPNGELLYKLTPFDEARASLSGVREKS